MPKISAGLLLYRVRQGKTEAFLVHPGGPFWAKKDAGAWSIPKGEPAPGEDFLAVAKREFQEETGLDIDGHFRALSPVRQRPCATKTLGSQFAAAQPMVRESSRRRLFPVAVIPFMWKCAGSNPMSNPQYTCRLTKSYRFRSPSKLAK